MLEVFPGHDDPILQELTAMIWSRLQSEGLAGGNLNPAVVFPHKGGALRSGTGEPVNESETEELNRQHMIEYGRNGARHFEAVRA